MKAHRTDGVSLSFGLIFLAGPIWWLITQVTTVRLPALGWLAAGALILIGVVGLLTAIRSGRHAEVNAPAQTDAVSTHAPAETGPVEAGPDAPAPDQEHADIVRELLESPADRPLPDERTGPEASPGQRPV